MSHTVIYIQNLSLLKSLELSEKFLVVGGGCGGGDVLTSFSVQIFK